MDMDELRLLCAQELMDEFMKTASSPDKEHLQELEVLTFLYAQNLIDDLMSCSASSSDDEEADDDEFLAILGYSQLQERSIAAVSKKSRDNNKISAKNNPKLETINSLLESRKTAITAVLEKAANNSKETYLENGFPDLSTACDDQQVYSRIFTNNEDTNTSKRFRSSLDHRIIESLSDDDFKHYFHIKRESFNYLMDKFSSWHYQEYYEQASQNPDIKNSLLSFLWFCANPVSFESAARMFSLSLLDYHRHLKIVLDFLDNEFSAVLKLPSSYMEKEAIAKEFEKIEGFPNVLGCLALSSFPLKLPQLVEPSGAPQLNLRGICDAKRKFLNIKILFSNQFQGDAFLENILPKLCFPKYHLLGDSTCPIRDHLVIPFAASTVNLSESEQFFNTKFCQTHMKIKQTFGMLRNRFRQLHYLDFNSIEMLSKFLTACCILHNICIDRQDFYDDEPYGHFDSSLSSVQADEFLQDLGFKKRQELKQILLRKRK